MSRRLRRAKGSSSHTPWSPHHCFRPPTGPSWSAASGQSYEQVRRREGLGSASASVFWGWAPSRRTATPPSYWTSCSASSPGVFHGDAREGCHGRAPHSAAAFAFALPARPLPRTSPGNGGHALAVAGKDGAPAGNPTRPADASPATSRSGPRLTSSSCGGSHEWYRAGNNDAYGAHRIPAVHTAEASLPALPAQ